MSQLGLGMAAIDDGPKRPRGRGRSLVAVGIAVVVVVALLVGIVFLAGSLLGGQGTDDYTGEGGTPVSVVIPKGASLTEIGQVLAEADVVRSADVFVTAAEANDDAKQIQPGTYTLPTQISGASAVVALLDPANRITEKVTVPEGLTVPGTVTLLARKTHLTRKDLEAALAHPKTLGLPDYAKNKPEGFLFPATYSLEPATDAETQLQGMVARFQQSADTVNLDERAADVGLSPYEVVIVASLLQAEVRPEDFAKVARVIYNRIDAGMPLQLDTTVNFALGKTGTSLTPEDLAVDSPYNTYTNQGLPPGPINSPGEAALEAALSPAQGPWIYYVTVDLETGKTKFTDSYQKFLEYKAEFQASQ